MSFLFNIKCCCLHNSLVINWQKAKLSIYWPHKNISPSLPGTCQCSVRPRVALVMNYTWLCQGFSSFSAREEIATLLVYCITSAYYIMLHNHDLVTWELLEIAPVCHSEGFIIAIYYICLVCFPLPFYIKWKKQQHSYSLVTSALLYDWISNKSRIKIDPIVSQAAVFDLNKSVDRTVPRLILLLLFSWLT